MSQFQQLMQDLDAMTKSLPATEGQDDKKIQAAAAGGEGGASGGEDEAAAAAAAAAAAGEGDGKKGEGEGEGEPMAKSFEVTLPDGKKVNAVDAELVLKSLNDRIDGLGADVSGAMTAAVALIKKQGEVLVEQGTMLKSLTEQVAKFSSQGAGRKTVLTMHETPAAAAGDGKTMAKGGAGAAAGEGKAMSSEQFLAKCLVAQREGLITGLDVSVAEANINRGQQPPEAIVRRVMGSAA